MSYLRRAVSNSEERLMYIEFCLTYKGEVSRSDITDMFDVQSASATRDLIKYNQDSDNSYFDEKRKKHIINYEKFKPKYIINDVDVLSWLNKEKTKPDNRLVTYRCQRINLPSMSVLAPITRAIYQKKTALIEYSSINSGKSERVIAPHSIFDDGLRIYIRAYDRKRNDFIDLSSSRILKSSFINKEKQSHELIGNDYDWNKEVELLITPHPKIKNKETIEFEYKMVRGELNITSRASCAGYFLKAWGVDCSELATKDHNEYHLHLKNIKNLMDIESINKLAPK